MKKLAGKNGNIALQLNPPQLLVPFQNNSLHKERFIEGF
jgi:hypothetical protein